MPDAQTTNPWTTPWEPTTELFSVALHKKDAPLHVAKYPDDFKRVQVQAESTLAAMTAKEVQAEADKGWRPYAVVKPGMDTHEEVMARERQILGEQPPLDRSKI